MTVTINILIEMVKLKLEDWFKPMLCESGTMKDLENSTYIGELKVDGTRVIVEKEGDSFKIFSRRGLLYNETLPEIVQYLKAIKHDYRIEGEVVYIDANGHMIFRGSQYRCQISNTEKVKKAVEKYPVGIYLFEITMLDGIDISKMPYHYRRKVLETFFALNNLLFSFNNIRLIPTSMNKTEMYKLAIENGFEGLVLKKLSSIYEFGKRSTSWLKVKGREHSIWTMQEPEE